YATRGHSAWRSLTSDGHCLLTCGQRESPGRRTRHNAACRECVSLRRSHALLEALRVFPSPVNRGLPVTGRGRLACLEGPLPPTDLPASAVLIEVCESPALFRRCAM